MRRNVMVLGLAALAAAAAPAGIQAQTPRGQEMRAGLSIERIIEQRDQLGLTDQQVTELRRIAAELEQKNAPLLAQLRESRVEMRADGPQRTEAERDSMLDRMRRMSPEQRDSMRARMRPLTPEQRDSLRAEMRSRMQERGDRPDLSPELRSAMEQVRSNTQAAMEQVRATLTPEQQQKLRELMPERGSQRPGPRGPAARRGAAPRGAR